MNTDFKLLYQFTDRAGRDVFAVFTRAVCECGNELWRPNGQRLRFKIGEALNIVPMNLIVEKVQNDNDE